MFVLFVTMLTLFNLKVFCFHFVDPISLVSLKFTLEPTSTVDDSLVNIIMHTCDFKFY